MSGLELFGYAFVVIYYLILALLCRSVWNHWKKRSRIGVAITSLPLLFLIVFPGFSWEILPGSSIYWDLKQTHEMTGHSFWLGSPRWSYHSERSFTGDGYSIEVFSLSEGTASKFIPPSSDFFSSFPNGSTLRPDWDVNRWQETPTHREDKIFIAFALEDYEQQRPELTKAQQFATRLLSEEGNFYAYLYKYPGSYVANVDFMILSPRERVLVIINFNT